MGRIVITNIEKITPGIIPNVTVKKVYTDNGLSFYTLHANEGYQLHDKVRDGAFLDPVSGEETFYLGYTADPVNCSIFYEFSPGTVTDENGVTHTAYGEREFFAVKI